MVKAVRTIKAFYSKIIRIICLAHGLQRTPEKYNSLCLKVDKLIASMKKVLLTAVARIELFKKEAPDVSLPLSPIITHWGRWLEATMYYYKYFKPILNVFQKLNAEDTISIEKIIMLEKNLLEADLFKLWNIKNSNNEKSKIFG